MSVCVCARVEAHRVEAAFKQPLKPPTPVKKKKKLALLDPLRKIQGKGGVVDFYLKQSPVAFQAFTVVESRSLKQTNAHLIFTTTIIIIISNSSSSSSHRPF